MMLSALLTAATELFLLSIKRKQEGTVRKQDAEIIRREDDVVVLSLAVDEQDPGIGEWGRPDLFLIDVLIWCLC